MGIQIRNFTKRFGQTTVIDNMNLDIESGEMIALLGPSGCGKSTTLFAISGIHKIDEGQLLLAGEDVTGKPPQQRNVGVIFQSYALYPHMTVEENIGFPLMIRKEAKADIKRKVQEMTELVGLKGLLGRKPAELSGGQQQRVSLARAMIRRPEVLLLDEPLANLDARLRITMRAEIRRIQQETGITAVLVTHDQVEAMSMCDRIAIMRDGKVLQYDTPEQMYQVPANDYVAGFMGNPPTSFLSGHLEHGTFRSLEADVQLPLPVLHSYSDQPVRLGLRPEHVRLEPQSANTATISFIENQGRELLYDLTLADGSVIRTIQPVNLHYGVGQSVHWDIDPHHILVFDEQGDLIHAG
ncbi:ABC transporter ATP-binding protein [Gynuella sunshinyii]|uniref:ABC-type sugar transport system, ATPase component n=1 Tax=Gynuella sunshinyii YC6258 TaxID=1445510 RepID=A0A0C5VEQ1_9GAMM|nr:ABC transporter ATP-binding protein [Gynuella sunshinyii]AJQ92676.1 ABC-type sugar transport system, ATPase component [Gynuella sunshinyii YC6258]